MREVKVLYRQTIPDLAIQELGDAERAVEIAEMNGLSLTDELEAGQVLMLPDYDIQKRDVVQLFSDRALAPATGDEDVTIDEGIDFWVIEKDFIVQ